MTYTANNMIQAVGQKVMVGMESCKFFVPMIVMDVKNVYGTVRLLVTPEHGEGEAWIELSRCKMSSSTEIAVY